MGTSKRYAAHFDRLDDEHLIDRLAQQGPLKTLSARELQLDVLPVTMSPQPEAVRAWVRFGDEPHRVRAVAERWTRYAVGIRFAAKGIEYKCWVWNSAVDTIPEADSSGTGGGVRRTR